MQGIAPNQAEEKLRALAQHFGTDPAATDRSRVLRLPGFVNHKYSEPHIVRGWRVSEQLHQGAEFKVEYDAGRRLIQPREMAQPAVNPGENTQSHADFRFALHRIGQAIKRGRKPDLAEIAERIDRFRNELYAQGHGKQKLPSRGETYGERTARRAYERYVQPSNLSPDAASVIKNYIARNGLRPDETLTVTFNNSQGDAVERTATAGRALSSEFAHTVETIKQGGYTLAAVDRAVHPEKHEKDRLLGQAMELSQGAGR